jgi:hypothetical protein
MSPVSVFCGVCGSVLPPGRRPGGRCLTCHARLEPRDHGDVHVDADGDVPGRSGAVICPAFFVLSPGPSGPGPPGVPPSLAF